MTRSFSLVLLLFLAVSPVLGEVEPAFDSWCSFVSVEAVGEEETALPDGLPSSLELRGARYEVDVLGNMAAGSLVLEFYNPTSETLQVEYHARKPGGLRVESIRAQVGDTEEIDWTKLQHARTAPTKQKVAGRRQAPRQPAAAVTRLALPASETVKIHKQFQQTLPFNEDRFELLLPAIGGDCSGLTESWPEDGLPGAPLDVRVRLHHDRPLALAESPSHEVLVSFEDSHNLVELLNDPFGDRMFELGFALGETDEPVLTAYTTPDVDGVREVMIVLAPALETARESIRPKEALFVLDTSGSMAKEGKIQEATKALSACLEKVAPNDLFNIVEFSNEFTTLHPQPTEGAPDKLSEAQSWLAAQRAGGGTSLFPPLAEAFDQPHDPDYHRLVVVLTDGNVGDKREVEQFLEERLGEARLFLVGIGEDANEKTILHLAQLGRGTAVFAKNADQLARAVTELFAGIASPVAWDLELNWGGAEVLSIEPQRVPDLYAGRPVTIRVRVRGELPPELLVEASTMDGVRVFQAALPAGGAREYEQFGRKSE